MNTVWRIGVDSSLYSAQNVGPEGIGIFGLIGRARACLCAPEIDQGLDRLCRFGEGKKGSGKGLGLLFIAVQGMGNGKIENVAERVLKGILRRRVGRERGLFHARSIGLAGLALD